MYPPSTIYRYLDLPSTQIIHTHNSHRYNTTPPLQKLVQAPYPLHTYTTHTVDNGILLHKLKDMGITGNLGIWFFQFLTNRTHYVRIPGGKSKDSPVLSGVPQGTVMGSLLFLIMISDINKGTASSKLVSFADDTRVYSNIAQADDCDNLQSDLNSIYNWAVHNNMFFNSQKFHYIVYSCCCVVYPLPWPLLVGGVRCSRLWSTSQLLRPSGQQCSHSGGVCPQIQGRQCGAYVGAVEEMMCVVCVDVAEGA